MKYFQVEADVTYMIWAESESDAQAIILEALKRGIASLGKDWTMLPKVVEVKGLKNGTFQDEVSQDNS